MKRTQQLSCTSHERIINNSTKTEQKTEKRNTHPLSYRYRNSCLQMFYKIVSFLKAILKNFANFAGKYLCRI